MPNAAFFIGQVLTKPELRVEGEESQVIFNLDISFQGQSFGWIKVVCLGDIAKSAAELELRLRVAVFGRLIRGSWKTGDEIWWEEIVLVAHYLEPILL